MKSIIFSTLFLISTNTILADEVPFSPAEFWSGRVFLSGHTRFKGYCDVMVFQSKKGDVDCIEIFIESNDPLMILIKGKEPFDVSVQKWSEFLEEQKIK